MGIRKNGYLECFITILRTCTWRFVFPFGRYVSLVLSGNLGVICDDNDFLLGSCITIHHQVAYSFAAKAIAVVFGLQFGLHLGLHSIILEGDVCSIILKLKEDSRDMSIISSFMRDGKAIAQKFGGCTFNFIQRLANKALHTMARGRLPYLVDRFWIEEAPPTVASVVEEDKRNLDPP
ncbi:hypothetical protein V6N13_071949 [Hibiscus sabdariffa]